MTYSQLIKEAEKRADEYCAEYQEVFVEAFIAGFLCAGPSFEPEKMGKGKK